MILPLAVFLQIAAGCAPQIAPTTLAAIARTESRFNPWAIHDNTTGRSYWPRDKAEAVAIAAPLLAGSRLKSRHAKRRERERERRWGQ